MGPGPLLSPPRCRLPPLLCWEHPWTESILGWKHQDGPRGAHFGRAGSIPELTALGGNLSLAAQGTVTLDGCAAPCRVSESHVLIYVSNRGIMEPGTIARNNRERRKITKDLRASCGKHTSSRASSIPSLQLGAQMPNRALMPALRFAGCSCSQGPRAQCNISTTPPFNPPAHSHPHQSSPVPGARDWSCSKHPQIRCQTLGIINICTIKLAARVVCVQEESSDCYKQKPLLAYLMETSAS